jgi:hypothetical protein
MPRLTPVGLERHSPPINRRLAPKPKSIVNGSMAAFLKIGVPLTVEPCKTAVDVIEAVCKMWGIPHSINGANIFKWNRDRDI